MVNTPTSKASPAVRRWARAWEEASITTTTSLIKELLERAAGAKVGLIGTNRNMIGDVPDTSGPLRRPG